MLKGKESFEYGNISDTGVCQIRIALLKCLNSIIIIIIIIQEGEKIQENRLAVRKIVRFCLYKITVLFLFVDSNHSYCMELVWCLLHVLHLKKISCGLECTVIFRNAVFLFNFTPYENCNFRGKVLSNFDFSLLPQYQ